MNGGRTTPAGSDIKLLVISNECPYPPNSGGKVDQWNRYTLFQDHGVQSMLVTWVPAHATADPAILKACGEVFTATYFHPIGRDFPALLQRLARLPFYSPHVSTRILPDRAFENLVAEAKRFSPHAIWLDGLYGGETAVRLRERLGVPLFYRSHNIEFRYMRSQASVATSVRDRFAWSVAALHLQSFEKRVRNAATEIFDLSVDDMTYWAGQGMSAGIYAPPLFRSAATRNPSPEWDVVFLGNFNTPNNLRGLRWFLDEVYPILIADVPDIRILFAGSSQDAEWRKSLARYSRVTLIENPPDSGSILANGRVLINPIFSGSGVNIKSIEMLLCGSPVVTTTTGVRGFPREFRSKFGVADTPADFARLILEGRKHPDLVSRRDVELTFGSQGIGPLIENIRRHLPSGAGQVAVQSM